MTDEMTKKFSKEKLIESLEHLANTCLVFHRDSSVLQGYDVKCENYLFDFMIQAVDLAEVKRKLVEDAVEME
jgi:hypothetical protein